MHGINMHGVKGQKQREHGAGTLQPLSAANPQRTIMPPHDLKGDRQTQAGSVLTLRCKEGLEDLFPNLGMNARARIRDGDG